MVKKNDNDNTDIDDLTAAPAARRPRLFGRRSKAAETAAEVQEPSSAGAKAGTTKADTATSGTATSGSATSSATGRAASSARGTGAKATQQAKATEDGGASHTVAEEATKPVLTTTTLLFQAPDLPPAPARSASDEEGESSSHRRRTRRRSGEGTDHDADEPNTVVKVRGPRQPAQITEPQRVKGSTRLEAKKQRRRDGRDAGRRRPVVTESEFLARRESVDRVMVVRSKNDRTQIGVLEDGILVEHYVARSQEASLIGNVYLGRVQNVLPSMEAAFVDIGRGRNAVLYSGEVDWEAAAAAAESDGNKNQARRIELALKPGDRVLVQVTKDPVGHKGARLTSQISLPGRYLVYVPGGSMNGISRKLPDTERARLKKILKEILPENAGVIVRTAAEGATEEQLTRDVSRLTKQWDAISKAVEKGQAPALLHSEPDLLIKIIRDVFNEDFQKLVVEGEDAEKTIGGYLEQVAPDLLDRLERHEGEHDSFEEHRILEQIEKALDRKVWLPSGGSLVIDRTEAMTVVDVNTGKFVGSGGNLEETVTKNNLEAAEEIVRQLRLRDIGGIIVIDFIDMVLESNRDLVLRRLVECLSRDRTKHQVAEVTSLGLVQMTRKKLGLGLLETFSEACEACGGRGVIVHAEPVTRSRSGGSGGTESKRGRSRGQSAKAPAGTGTHAITEDAKHALAQIAASTIARTEEEKSAEESSAAAVQAPVEPASTDATALAAPVTEEVAILDIPVKKSRRSRSVPQPEAEQLLDKVFEALPEPKAPGTARKRAPRRATSATVEAPPAAEEG